MSFLPRRLLEGSGAEGSDVVAPALGRAMASAAGHTVTRDGATLHQPRVVAPRTVAEEDVAGGGGLGFLALVVLTVRDRTGGTKRHNKQQHRNGSSPHDQQ